MNHPTEEKLYVSLLLQYLNTILLEITNNTLQYM